MTWHVRVVKGHKVPEKIRLALGYYPTNELKSGAGGKKGEIKKTRTKGPPGPVNKKLQHSLCAQMDELHKV